MNDIRIPYRAAIEAYRPQTPQEAADREATLRAIEIYGDALLTRAQEDMHLTASAMILNPAGDQVLMAFHNIYQSWAWTGGHADGDRFPYETALREAREETGVQALTPLSPHMISFDALPVLAHMKNGKAVPAHVHLNATYAFIADEMQPLTVCEGENRAVGWLPIAQLSEYVREAEMLPVYEKLIKRVRRLMAAMAH